MIEVEITTNMLEKAKKRATELGVLKNSITKGEGNLAGFVGEYAALEVIGGEIADTRDYDILRPNGRKADIKTKRCSSIPLPHFECSIANFNTQQNCDDYVFVRVMNDFSKAWVLGELPKEEYFQKAKFYQQGQFDPRNRWRCKADCYNVAISELNECQRP